MELQGKKDVVLICRKKNSGGSDQVEHGVQSFPKARENPIQP